MNNLCVCVGVSVCVHWCFGFFFKQHVKDTCKMLVYRETPLKIKEIQIANSRTSFNKHVCACVCKRMLYGTTSALAFSGN